MGRDPKYICQKPQPKTEPPANLALRSSMNNEAASSDDEDEEDEVGSTHSSSNSGNKPDTMQTSTEGQPG